MRRQSSYGNSRQPNREVSFISKRHRRQGSSITGLNQSRSKHTSQYESRKSNERPMSQFGRTSTSENRRLSLKEISSFSGSDQNLSSEEDDGILKNGECCRTCGKTYDEDSEDNNVKEDILLSGLPAAVLAVANRMKQSQTRRSREATKYELDAILHRVTMALHHFGIDTRSSNSQHQTAEDILVYNAPEFDIEHEKNKREARQNVLETMKGYSNTCGARQDLIRDLGFWFDKISSPEEDDLLSTSPTPTEIFDSTHRQVTEAFEVAENAAERLKFLVNRVFSEEMGGDISKDGLVEIKEDDTEETDNKNKIKKFYTDVELQDTRNWKIASRSIVQNFDEVIRITHGSQSKQLLRQNLKQFRVFSSVIDKKVDEFSKIDAQFAERGMGLQRAMKDNEKNNELRKRDQSKIHMLENENAMLWEKLNTLQSSIDNSVLVAKPEKQARERRMSTFLPSAEGKLAVPNSVKEESEDDDSANTNRGVEHIQRKYSLAPSPAPEDIAEEDSAINNELNNVRRMSSVGQGRRMSISERRMSLAQGKKLPSNAEAAFPEEEQLNDGSFTIAENTPQPSVEKVDSNVVKVLDDTINTLKMDLTDARKTIEDQALRINELEEEILRADKLDDYIVELENAKDKLEENMVEVENKHNKILDSLKEEHKIKVEHYQRKREKFKSEIEIRDEQIKHQDKCIDELTSDMQRILEEKLTMEEDMRKETSKLEALPMLTKTQAVSRVKNQYEAELQRLRDYLAKEQQRFQAELRKVQQEQKKDIQSIHKESLQMLRAVNRFKDSIASILEKESLLEEAFEMRQLEPLPMDTFGGTAETRQMLSKMALSATELLINLETKLSKALLNKRLEIKDTTAAKGFVLRDLEGQMDKLRKAKESGALQYEKLRKYEERNQTLTERYRDLMNNHMMLQKELIPYRQLIEQHITLQKEMTIMKKSMLNVNKDSSSQKQDYEKDRDEMIRAMQEQHTVISNLKERQKVQEEKHQRDAGRVAATYYTSKVDQKRNIEILNEAFNKDNISSETHEQTVDLIKKTMDLPRVRFVHLVQRYMAHVRLKALKEVMTAALGKYKNNIRLTQYVNQMEQRIDEKQKKWDARKKQLVRLRGDVYEKLMTAMKKVTNEAGILLIHPLSKQSKSLGPSNHKHKRMSFGRSVDEKLGIPESVVGNKINAFLHQPAMWKMPPMADSRLIQINTPRLLEMDINQWSKAAESLISGEISNDLPSTWITSVKLAKIKKDHASKLTLPPIASIYPEE